MSFRVSTANWQWRYFAAPQIPDMLDSVEGFIGQTLTLPDGRVLQSVPFDFPEGGIINMYDIMPELPEVSARTVVVAEFTADADGSLFIGFGGDWKWTLRFNGQMLLDARVPANSEAPVSYNNHAQELVYKQGRNQLVFEIFGGTYRHPGINGGMDIAFKIIEKAPALKMVYPPFVSFPDAHDNAVSVIFAANRKTPAAVEYRLSGSSEWNRVYDNLGGQMRHDRAVHSIRLEDLLPGRDYEYQVILIDDFRALEELPQGVHKFRSAAGAGQKFSFIATADLQNPDTRTEYLENLIGDDAPFENDFFAFIGDLFWTTDYDRSVMDEFIVPFTRIAGEKMPLVMVRGNHEIYGKQSNRYFEYFTPPFPYREGYYMFKWGDVCFIVLDFCDDAPNVPPPSTRQFHDFEPYIAAEAKWLKKAVNEPMCRDAKYRIVLAHGIPLGDVQSYMPEHVRQVIDPVFGGKDPLVRIHLWMGGHIHRAFRSVPLTNRCCSMKPLDELSSPHPPIGVNYSFPVVVTGGPYVVPEENMQFTSIRVEVDVDKLTVSSFDRFNKEFDCITITPDGVCSEIRRAEEFKCYEY